MLPALHIGAHPHNRQTLPATQPLVKTWSSISQHTRAAHSVFTAVNMLGLCARTGYTALMLHRPTAPLMGSCCPDATGPQLCCSFTQANWSLALSNQHYSWAITEPSTLVDAWSPRPGESETRVGLIIFNATQYLYSPFQDPTYSQRSYH